TYPDIYVATGGQNKLWLNDGSANFTAANISGDTGESYDAEIADLNGDTYPDIYVANNDGGSVLWLNDGSANFTSSDIAGDDSIDGIPYGVAVADLNGDTYLDIYVATSLELGTIEIDPFATYQNILLLNDGAGNFTASNITGDDGKSIDAEIADLNGDTYPDIYTVGQSDDDISDSLWLNDGAGNFTEGDHILSSNVADAYDAEIADLNGDTYPDIYVSTNTQNELWLNDGAGNFTASNITGDTENSYGSTIADLDGDGNSDIYVANDDKNQLWLFQYPDVSYVELNTAAHFTSSITSFSHTLGLANEGNVRYQISIDGGDNWYYWHNLPLEGAWVATTLTNGSETSAVNEVNDHISSITSSGGNFLFRAYLFRVDDENEYVELDQVAASGSFVDFTVTMTHPSSDTEIPNLSWSPFTFEIECTQGDCGDIDLYLDPIGSFFFEKTDYGSEEDCITDNVCITRGDNKGIYNSVTESGFDSDDYTSPADTEWTGEECGDDPTIHTYQDWNDAVFDTGVASVSEMVGIPFCVHLITDDVYVDLEFQSWTSGGAGGGFSYYRTTVGKGLIPTTPTQPFYTSSANPFTLSVGEGETATHTFMVYADSEIGESFDFFGYADYAGGTNYQETTSREITIGEAVPEAETISPSGGRKYSCKDPNATNYDPFGAHDQLLCVYEGGFVPFTQCELFTQNLHIPARDGVYNNYTQAVVTEVAKIQHYLNQSGFESGVEDGIIGPITDHAIRQLQTAFGIVADGYVGPITRSVINQYCLS
ncbi:VCBS repeat-containing protein, partial [Patescibacteria group bacterium]|nr:VCBS repeat-containing protein [Patescibacteria group bacterium]